MTRTRFDLEILNSYDEKHNTIGKECQGRLDRALFIALNRQILDHDGWFMVESQRRPGPDYRVTENDCTCRDSRAPVIEGRKHCKHRLAVDLVLMARFHTQVWDEEVVNTEPDPLPEDLVRISVSYDTTYGRAALIVKNWRRQWYIGISAASIKRISSITCRAQDSPHWRCRPALIGDIGYVLERSNYA